MSGDSIVDLRRQLAEARGELKILREQVRAVNADLLQVARLLMYNIARERLLELKPDPESCSRCGQPINFHDPDGSCARARDVAAMLGRKL